MEKRAYAELKDLQDSHWWFTGKRKIIVSVIDKYVKSFLKKPYSELRTLDIGCGMGGLIQDIKRTGADCYGMDCEMEAVDYCQRNGMRNVFYGELPGDNPFGQDMFDIITLSDCLEHIEEDGLALQEIRKLMSADKAFLVLTVPALMSLWSYNDEFNHHKRRYKKKQLMDLVNNAGYQVRMCSYYNFYLFPIVWIIRVMKNLFHIRKDDLQNVKADGMLNCVLEKIFASERLWLRNHVFPIGVSLILVASLRND